MPSVTVKGGKRVRRFVHGVTSNPNIAADAAFPIIRDRVLPALKARLTRRTGRLIQSMHVVKTGTTIELRGIFYAPLVTFPRGGRRVTVQDLFIELVAAYAPQIRTAIRAAVRAAGGV